MPSAGEVRPYTGHDGRIDAPTGSVLRATRISERSRGAVGFAGRPGLWLSFTQGALMGWAFGKCRRNSPLASTVARETRRNVENTCPSSSLLSNVPESEDTVRERIVAASPIGQGHERR